MTTPPATRPSPPAPHTNSMQPLSPPALPPASTDQVIILQHPPVYTLGAGSTRDNLLFDPDDTTLGAIPVVRTERGGEVTYHGPGQVRPVVRSVVTTIPKTLLP